MESLKSRSAYHIESSEMEIDREEEGRYFEPIEWLIDFTQKEIKR